METVKGLEQDLENMREYYRHGKTMEASWRKSQLKGLLTLLKEKERDIFKALKQDLGKHPIESFRDEIGTLIKSLNLALESLQEWMSGRKAKLPRIALLTTAEIVPEPLGLVLIISSWNFPFGLSLEPLIGAIAAGNTVVLKLSELAPACASLLANNIPTYMDNNAVKVVEGGPAVGEQLLQQKWDKIFFTGSERIGRLVMSAAVKHLTPVTLELGGKCPAIVDSLSSSWEMKVAIKRILMAKCGSCAGQACIAIDYMLAERKSTPPLVEFMKATIKEMFGENPKESCSIGRIVNKHHFMRLKDLLNDPNVKASIVYGGSSDEDNLFIEPTILVDPPLHAAIMTEEIFGPLLPIITYAADTLPFGGVGESGVGRYHGKFSFDTFSHEKAIVRRSFLTEFWFRFPPWNTHKLQLLECTYNYDYLGLLLVILGLKRCRRSYQADFH
ncbi:aldehyde dehydrogenase family 3 member F1-like isoform X2 [Alnus glutinosa]|uniref:aldehyde dehydrogenase family 3 member F1-like isoform X2 n=1 Tax=Alnus glutinosa TaxID=3517 RepID=UPI002D79205D|nr:aldehyde dehydrogenase family 3 member F1-like isoform X2 [Alnus glutinosa]